MIKVKKMGYQNIIMTTVNYFIQKTTIKEKKMDK